MSTAEHPDALTRRIEQLAAASSDEPEGAAVAALIGALRGEIGSVRAELGALRSETGAVRSDLDGLGGRLTGSVAASRAETSTLVRRVAELSSRLEGVGGQVDDVRNGLPGLARELREGLDDVPTRTGQQIDELTDRLAAAVGLRVDVVAESVSGTVSSALDREAETAAATRSALEDARGALEARMAVLEDALDGLSERIEALARDGASTTTSTLGTLTATVRGLDERVVGEGRDAAERTSALEGALFDRLSDVLRTRSDELRRDVLGAVETVRSEAAEDRAAAAEQAQTLRSALDGLASGLDRSLSGLGASVTGALGESRDETRAELDEVVERLSGAVVALRTELVARDDVAAGQLSGLQSSVEGRVEGLRSQLADAMTVLRSGVASELGALAPRVDELAGRLGARIDQQYATVAERLAVLAADVTGATTATRETGDRLVSLATAGDDVRRTLDEARETVVTATGELRATVESGLIGVGGRVDALGATVGQSKDSTREAGHRLLALADAVRTQREELVRQTSEQLAALGQRLGGLDTTLEQTATDVRQRLAELDVTVGLSTSTAERSVVSLAELAVAHEGLSEAVAGFRAEWPTRTFEVVQGAKAVSEAVARDVRNEIEAQLVRVREELARATDEMEGARDGLASGTDRLSRAGKVLVGYLEQRDRLLEAERDRVLHDVLDSFASGLSARERTALAGRVGDVVNRRRDARDAERYRSAVGQPTPPAVDVPDEVTRLVPDDAAAAREAAPPRAEPARPPELPPVARAPHVAPGSPAKRPARTVSAAPSVQRAPAAKAAAPARRAAARKAAPSKAAPSKAGGSSGRLAQMPEVPDVGLALDAAAPPSEPPRAAPAPEERVLAAPPPEPTVPSGPASAPVAESVQDEPAPPDVGDGERLPAPGQPSTDPDPDPSPSPDAAPGPASPAGPTQPRP